MQTTLRPGAKQVATHQLITAGFAVAGLIAVAPGVTPVLPHLQHELQASAVRLTAGWDPLTAWQNAFNTASTNASTLADNFLLAPGVGLQQAIVNQVGYLNQVRNDPSSLNTVLTQIATNAQTVASGLTGLNASAATTKAAQAHSLDALHGALVSLLPTFLPPDVDAATVTQVLQVLSSPLSGLLIGAVGPVISPGVALLNTVLAVGAALHASDPSAALSHLLDAPANVVNAFFNGADLNLDALVPLINNAGILPAGTTINALDYAFGGLLSVGSVSNPNYTQGGTLNPGIKTPGGSILNGLGLTVTTDALGAPLTLKIPSNAVGPLGALESISQTVGVLLGSKWDGKKAVQVPPLSTLDFPTLSDTAPDPAAVNAAAITPATAPAGAASLPSTAAKSVTLSIGSTAASTPAETETSAGSPADASATGAADAAADTPKDSAAPPANTPAASTSGAESSSTTTDSTPKDDSTDASDVKKPTDKRVDVKTGNKVEPGTTAGSGATNSGDAASSTTSHETTTEQAGTASTTTSGGADTGADNGADAA